MYRATSDLTDLLGDERPKNARSQDFFNARYSNRLVPKPPPKKSSYEIKGKVLLHQLRTVDKNRLGKKIANISLNEMKEINEILEFILGLK